MDKTMYTTNEIATILEPIFNIYGVRKAILLGSIVVASRTKSVI